MACAEVDPRMFDLIWTDRLEYEALLHKRPVAVCTVAEPTSAPVEKKEPAKPKKSAPKESSVGTDSKSLLADLEAARGFIRASLQESAPVTTVDSLNERAAKLETSNNALRKLVEDLTSQIEKLEAKAKARVGGGAPVAATPAKPAEPAKPVAAQPTKKEDDDDDDDDFDFGDSDEEDEPKGETEMQRMKREAAEKKAAEAAKKPKKPAPVLKSNVVLDVKPWDDETDLGEMEKGVRGIVIEGLVWGDSKLVEIGFGIKKLRISTCIVDELVGLYDLEDKIQELEDYVQSVDIVSHNKI